MKLFNQARQFEQDQASRGASRSLKRSLNRRGAGRRRGVVALYVASGMLLFLGVAALAVDMSSLYARRTKAQRAADAAALAGAYQLTLNVNDPATAITKAKQYAGMEANGGFVDGVNGAHVDVQTPYGEDPSSVHVTVSRPEPLFFARIFGMTTTLVGAGSTAAYDSTADITQNSQGYGSRDAAVYYSVYGPNAMRTNGDRFSTKYLDDKLTPNPDYDANGYDFIINVPANWRANNGGKDLQLEIFDPDTWNPNGQNIAGGGSYDEIRPGYTVNGDSDPYTRTSYYLYYGNDPSPIAQADYGNDLEYDPTTGRRQPPSDARWTTPKGMYFNPDDPQYGAAGAAKQFRLQVVTTKGSSENGFNLRAGPLQANGTESIDTGIYGQQYADKYGRLSKMSDSAWQAAYGNTGIQIAAQGKVPLNFNSDVTTEISLGHVPRVKAQSPRMTITRFDTDVPSSVDDKTLHVYYTNDAPGFENIKFKDQDLKRAENNDQTQQDVIPLDDASLTALAGRTYPAGGANWTAHYTAGNNDTSSWQVSYAGKGNPGAVRITH